MNREGLLHRIKEAVRAVEPGAEIILYGPARAAIPFPNPIGIF